MIILNLNSIMGMFCKGGTCAALIYVFKILIELRTHHKNIEEILNKELEVV